MEKPGLVRPHGVLRLPPGFRFHPTDEELVVQYLRRKVFRNPLPAAIIPEIQLSRYDPWDLPGGPEKERYFFNTREVKYPSGGRHNRASATGYWKATGSDRQVVASGGGHQVVGMKKTLVFYRGKAPNGSRTDWVMHEYCLAGAGSGQRKNATHSPTAQVEEDWVLCRIFQKRRPARSGVAMEASCNEAAVEDRGRRAGFIDFMGRSSRPPATPSDSEISCVTEVSDGCCSGEDSSCSSASSSSPPPKQD